MVLNIGICHLIKLFKHGKHYFSQSNSSKNRKCNFRIKVESDPSPKKLDEKVQAASHWPKLWICKTSKTLSEFPTPSHFPGTLLEMTCDGDILFSERSPTKAPTPVPTQSFSPTAFDPQDGLSSFHQILPQEPSELTLFLVNFQFNQDSGFAYMVFLALASYYVYRKNMEPKLPKTCMGLLGL